MKLLMIADGTEHCLTVALSDILSCVPHGDRFQWAVLDVDAAGDITELGMDIPQYENRVRNSDIGMPFEWRNLNTLASQLDEIVDLLLIGTRELRQLHKYADHAMMYASCEHVFELVDSSYWLIHTQDAATRTCLEAKFDDVSLVDS